MANGGGYYDTTYGISTNTGITTGGWVSTTGQFHPFGSGPFANSPYVVRPYVETDARVAHVVAHPSPNVHEDPIHWLRARIQEVRGWSGL